MTRLERLEKDSPLNDMANKISRILLVNPDGSIAHELWMRGVANVS
jgi:hypothetical protein